MTCFRSSFFCRPFVWMVFPLSILMVSRPLEATEKQVTFARRGHILTNIGVWSPDGQWIVYDTRSDGPGEVFDGKTIEAVNVNTGEVRELYRATNGAGCGMATFNPRENKVVFILGPENPTPDWQYAPAHRQGVVVDFAQPGAARNLDARDLTPPFTPGALRGGSHVCVWDAAGEWVSFTYDDDVVGRFKSASPTHDIAQRNVGVSVPNHPVKVSKRHPRNCDGDWFSVVVTRTVASPRPVSDEINRACEEGWVGTNGYIRADASRQRHALAFQGSVITAQGETISEVFVADLPADLTSEGEGPLCGTETRAPYPPRDVVQRRLTFTAERKFPGLQGARHWLRSSPDGSRIAFLMKDDAGVAQLWTISPNGGQPSQLTHNPWPIASAFSWSSDGRQIAHVMDQSVCVTDVNTGETTRLTSRSSDAESPRPEACVFSPDGKLIAFVRRVKTGQSWFNQIFVVKAAP
jgi:dipeptidyl aminopeptidase/acylaminoacyl peptidase